MTFPTQFVAKQQTVLLTPKLVVISANVKNPDIFSLAGSPSGATALTVQINAGVEVTSLGVQTALDFGLSFESNSTFVLNILAAGLVLGHGGQGGAGTTCIDNGDGTSSCGSAAPGGNGGHAIQADRAITIDNLGEIRGGGGGGGGGGCAANSLGANGWGGGGGGGVGSDPGLGGTGPATAGDGTAGNSVRPVGTPGVGGSGVSFGGNGAGGGDWAVAGSKGTTPSGPGGTEECITTGRNGGDPGAAVLLSAGTTTFVTTGTISGSVS